MPQSQIRHDSRKQLHRQKRNARDKIRLLEFSGLIEPRERTRLLAAIDKRYQS